MTNQKEKVPLVFISYSHDSRDHKQWVANFASSLLKNGIDVILDQWDLVLGDDVPKFMEKSLTNADRVLIVCTKQYVHKANDGKGGVGYEATIVTGELIRNLGTNKFIPIIRQDGTDLVPTSLSTRFHVNLSVDSNYEEQFERLIKELHNLKVVHKPPLGKNPFAEPTTPVGTLSVPKVDPSKENSESLINPDSIYDYALQIARANDQFEWRKLMQRLRKEISPNMEAWRATNTIPPKTEQELPNFVTNFAEIFLPIIIPACVGVESGDELFRTQTGIMDELLNPPNWSKAGYTVVAELPNAVGFIYQAIHGAIAIETSQIDLAFDLIHEKVTLDSNRTFAVWEVSDLIGWPDSLGRDSDKTWNFLCSLPQRWPWLLKIFGDLENFRVALSTYYMCLHINELVDAVKNGKESLLASKEILLSTPLRFQFESYEIRRKAYRKLLSLKSQLRKIWQQMNVDESTLRKQWPTWISQAKKLTSQSAPLMFYTEDMVHTRFFEDL